MSLVVTTPTRWPSSSRAGSREIPVLAKAVDRAPDGVLLVDSDHVLGCDLADGDRVEAVEDGLEDLVDGDDP